MKKVFLFALFCLLAIGLLVGCKQAADSDNTTSTPATYNHDANVHWHTGDTDYAPHAWNDGTTLSPATDTAPGIVLYTCTVCGAVKTETILPQPAEHAHTFATAWSKDETYHWHAATCGHDEVADKAPHQWDDGTITEPATESTAGIKTYTCTVCGATKTKSSPQDNPTVTTTTISFNLNGGHTSSSTTPITVTSLNKQDFFFDVTKDGYNFRGWSCNGIKVFDENGKLLNVIALQPRMTFVAQYSNTAKLTIITNLPDAGTYTGAGEYTYNSEVDVTATAHEGYDFVGWFYNNTVLSYQPIYRYAMWDKDVTLEAHFDYHAYQLEVTASDDTLGGVVINPSTIRNYEKHCLENIKYKSSVTIAALSRTDARFLGWFDKDSNLISTNAVYTFLMPKTNISYFAKWDYFAITYVLNGGTQNKNNPTYYTSTDSNVPLYAPTKTGAIFVEWQCNGKRITSISGAQKQDLILTAIWSQASYDISSNTDGTATLSNYTGTETTVVIPNSVTCIGDGAFKGNTRLSSVIIPSSVTSIGNEAFKDCSGLTAINIPNSIRSIGNYAFSNCSGLTAINIPNSVTSIGANAFSSSGITSITLPNSIECIETCVFYHCRNLTSISIPNSVTYIGHHAFSGCSNLDRVLIPDSVLCIDTYAFSLCEELSSITLGVKVSRIEDGAFSNCNKLQYNSYDNAYYLGNANTPYFALVKTIDYSVNRVNIHSSCHTICGDAFSACKKITSITIPVGVTSIGRNAFSNCSELTSITIPDSVTYIGNYAFSGCRKLTSVRYNGTKAQWNAIDKGANINGIYSSSKYTVYCKDGNIISE